MTRVLSDVVDAGDGLPLTFGALARARAAEHGQRTLLVCDDLRLSYAEADARSRRLARGMIAAGIGKGTHVGLLLPNGVDFLLGVLAAARIGAVVLPFSTLSSADELRWLLGNSDTAYLLTTAGYRSRDFTTLLRQAVPELDLAAPPPVVSTTTPWLKQVWFCGAKPDGVDDGWSAQTLEAAAETVDEALLDTGEARVTPADRAVIIHTSGTSGTPKGVIHAHGVMIRHRSNQTLMRGFGPDDVLFSPAPWFWVTGFSYSLLGTMIAGARMVCSNSTVACEVLDLLERERPTITNGYAPTVAWLAQDPSFPKRDLSSIRRGPLHPIMSADARPADPGLRHEPYGMTEGGSAITAAPDDDDLPEALRGANGVFLPGFEARIVDPATGQDCPGGEPGELWIRGPFMMLGYYNRHRSEILEPDGWYRTGDIGLISPEGFFLLKGRLNNMIKTSHANVSPREVEGVLSALTGGLLSVVLGVPDPARGEAVAAVVVSEEEGAVDEAALKNALAERLSSFKVPRRILQFRQAELPTLSSGKVDLRKLIEAVQARWDQ